MTACDVHFPERPPNRKKMIFALLLWTLWTASAAPVLMDSATVVLGRWSQDEAQEAESRARTRLLVASFFYFSFYYLLSD